MHFVPGGVSVTYLWYLVWVSSAVTAAVSTYPLIAEFIFRPVTILHSLLHLSPSSSSRLSAHGTMGRKGGSQMGGC